MNGPCSLSELKKALNDAEHSLDQSFRKCISWDLYLELEPSLDALINETSGFNVCYYDDHLIVSFQPSPAHESAHTQLIYAIAVSIDTANPQRVAPTVVMKGAGRYQTSLNQTSLEADSSIGPKGPHAPPALIIECGISQSYPDLERKMNAWFKFPSVLCVIIIKVNQDRERTSFLEIWRAPTPSGRVQLQDRLVMTRNTVMESLNIPYELIFRDGVPVWASSPDLVVPADRLQDFLEAFYDQL
ncbi:hypothetical protein C8J56DRAFT_502384 [Mycena floridula]|nr:hypothetical protein C8J56DRAFT_502384 [Mycena floridula]